LGRTYLDITNILNSSINTLSDYIFLRIAIDKINSSDDVCLSMIDNEIRMIDNRILADFVMKGSVYKKESYIINNCYPIEMDSDSTLICFTTNNENDFELINYFTETSVIKKMFCLMFSEYVSNELINIFDDVVLLNNNSVVRANSDPIFFDKSNNLENSYVVDPVLKKKINDEPLFSVFINSNDKKNTFSILNKTFDITESETSSKIFLVDFGEKYSLVSESNIMSIPNINYLHGLDYYTMKYLKDNSKECLCSLEFDFIDFL